jgi:type II secretory pathway pseudopilin PulG
MRPMLQPRRYLPLAVFFSIFALIFFFTLTCTAQSTPSARPESSSAQDLQKDPALLHAFGELLEKLQKDVQFPPARNESRLLPLLPESTVFFVALPNYGEATHQALAMFRQRVEEDPVLREWWHRGSMATEGPKAEDYLEKFYQLSQFLGDEVVASASGESRLHPSLLLVAEVRKPGLRDFLQQMAREYTAKSKTALRILDEKELAAAKDTSTEQPVILVRSDVVAAAMDVATLRSLNTRLDHKKREFVSTPFALRATQAYKGGITIAGALDLQRILKLAPPETGQSQLTFQRTGFADMKYLVWDRRTLADQTASEMELSFTGPRHGVASWLAAPGPLGSLDFVSPKALLAATVRLKNPAQIFDELRELSTASNPKAFESVAQMEAALKLSLKEDLLSHLGGELTIELDSFKPPDPVWRAFLQVDDPDRLQATLRKLLAVFPLNATQIIEHGVTYHTLVIPSATKVQEIGYAFVDGYLIIGSSKKVVADAIQLHRSGESLAKATKFLAALPPDSQRESRPEASALLYENPTAMQALSLRQILPDMAESLAQGGADAKPVVICAYGEESSIREITHSGGVDAGAVLVIAAIAIPNLMRAKIAANESSAAASIRTVNTAQISYSVTYPRRGFAPDLATLGPDSDGSERSAADHAALLDSALGNASCKSGTWCTKSGFQFSMKAVCKKEKCDEFVVVGTPASGSDGSRNFCSTSDAVVRVHSGPPLTTPVSVSECQAWPPLQ